MKKQMLSVLEGNKTNLSSRQFVGRDLPHPLLLGQEEKQPCFTRDVEDPRQRPSGMTTYFYNDYRGFTLIELLVVVLIIGILAAVAVPQYQKAVEKSKAVQALTLLKSVAQAGTAHYIASGSYATKFDELDVEIPWTGTTKGYTEYQATDTLSNNDWSIQLYNDGSVQNGIYVTRLTGAYKGAAFMWFFVGDLATTPLNQIVCYERAVGGVTFTKSHGDYCQKIMRGTEVSANSPMFSIPF